MTTQRPSGRRHATPAALGCAALIVMGALLPTVARAGLGAAPMTTPSGATVADLGHGPVLAARLASQNTVLAASSSAASSATSSGSASYTVLQTTLASGTVVHEYVATNGTVFGVAWSGPRMPDLSQLLGSYFPQYTSTVSASRRAGRRGPAEVAQQGLVVHSGGHMGAFSGEAWLPQALPAGVSASDIQ